MEMACTQCRNQNQSSGIIISYISTALQHMRYETQVNGICNTVHSANVRMSAPKSDY